MKKKFVTNLIILLFANILVKPFWIFGIDRNIQIAVGETDYGVYFTLFNLSLLLNILLDAGINSYNSRNISQHQFLLTKYFARIISLKFILGILYTTVTFSIGLIIGYRGEQLYLLLVLILNQFLSLVILYIRSNIAALQLFKSDSLMSVIDRILMIIICAFLLWGKIFDTSFKIEWLVYSQTITYIMTIIIGILILAPHIYSFKFSFNITFCLAILKKCMPYALFIFLSSFYTRIDSIMLEQISPNGAADVGIYAKGFRMLEAVNMLAYLFAVFLLPIFSNMIKKNEDISEILKIAVMLLLIPSTIASACCFFFRYEIMDTLYKDINFYDVTVFSILMFGFISTSISYIFGTLLTANGSMKQQNTIAVFVMFLNIVLNIILIPQFQAIGSAIISLSVQTAVALGQVIIVVKIFKIQVYRNTILKWLFYIFALVSVGFLLEILKAKLPSWNWLVFFAIYIMVMLAIAIILQIFKIKSIFHIIQDYNKNEEENSVSALDINQ